MNLFKQLFSPQLCKPYRDTDPRGHGNRAARRAISTARGREHLEFASEPIYTERPEILKNGHLLLIISHAHRVACDHPEKWFSDVRQALYVF